MRFKRISKEEIGIFHTLDKYSDERQLLYIVCKIATGFYTDVALEEIEKKAVLDCIFSQKHNLEDWDSEIKKWFEEVANAKRHNR